MLFARMVGHGLNAMSGSSLTVAAISDVCAGDTALMSESLNVLLSWAGGGVIVGTFLGGQILARTNSDVAVYAFRGLMGALHFLFNQVAVPETLPPEKRRPFNGRFVHPFTFFRLFSTSPMLTKMSVFNAFQILSEGKNLNDFQQIWMRADLGFSVQQAVVWTMAAGFGGLTCGIQANWLIKRFGPRGYTHIALASGPIAYLAAALPRNGLGMYLSLLLRSPGVNAQGSVPVRSLAVRHAVAAGMGLGESSIWTDRVTRLRCVFARFLS